MLIKHAEEISLNSERKKERKKKRKKEKRKKGNDEKIMKKYKVNSIINESHGK